MGSPPPPQLSDSDVDRIMSGNININVPGPAPTTREGLSAEAERLRFERENQPASTLTPLGQNPRINYGPGESSPTLFDPAEQAGLGLLRAGASIGKGALGGFSALESLTGGPLPKNSATEQANEYSAVERGLGDVASEGSTPLIAPIVHGVVSTAPQLLTGAVGGLPAIATAFGITSANSAYVDAQERGYTHPGTYAALSGLIAAGTSLIPGYKGPNMVAAASQMVQTKGWQQLAQELAGHAGSTALMMGVQSALQGALNQQTIDPNLTWKDIVAEAAESAGLGAVIGAGFGGLGKLAYDSTRRAQLTPILHSYLDHIQNSTILDLNANPPQPGHEQEARFMVPFTTPSKPVAPPVETPEESAYAVQQRNQGSLRLPSGVGTPEVKPSAPAKPVETPPPTPAPVPKVEAGNPTEDLINAAKTPNDVTKVMSYLKQLYGAGQIDEDQYNEHALAAAAKMEEVAKPLQKTAPPVDTRFLGNPKGTGAIPPTDEHLAAAQRTGFKAEPSSSQPGVEPKWGFQDKKGLSFYVAPGSTDAQILDAYNAKQSKPAPKLPPEQSKPVQPVTPVVATKGSLRGTKPPAPVAQKLVAGQIPKVPGKGEIIPLSETIHLTRNREGKIILISPESDKPLAVLKFKADEPRNVEKWAQAISRQGIMSDFLAESEGKKPQFWNLIKRQTTGMGKVRVQAKTAVVEQKQLNMDKVIKEVVAALGPDHSISQALTVGAISPELLTRLVGEDVLRKGGEAIAEDLKQQVSDATEKYIAMADKDVAEINKAPLSKYLLERTEAGQRGKVPEELLKTKKVKQDDGSYAEVPTGQVKSRKEIVDTFGNNPKELTARVLQILSGNKTVDLEAGAQPHTAPATDEEKASENKRIERVTAAAPVSEGFTDEDLNTPDKKKAASVVLDIKNEVQEGNTDRYDEAIKILEKVFGFDTEKAERLMESDNTVESPVLAGPRRVRGEFKQQVAEGTQILNRLKNVLHPDEWDIYKSLGIEEAFKGKKVDPNEVAQWMEDNGPKIEVKKFGEGQASPEKKEFNLIQHSVIDRLGLTPTFRGAGEFAGWKNRQGDIIHHVDYRPEDVRALNRWVELLPKVEGQSVDKSVAHWSSIAPKSEQDMPGYTEGAVTLPAKTDRMGTPTTESIKFGSSHNFPPNTIAFWRGYMETLPNGKKVFHVIEVQSDWAQAQRANRQYQQDAIARGTRNPSADAALDRTDHPLLKQYERLALKSAIEHAKAEGADAIAISDAETAMMTEGHDRAVPVGAILENPTREQMEPQQAPGMRLHYDQTLPKIAEELTGTKGERVEFGEHRMAMQAVNPERFTDPIPPQIPRKDLIFREPTGEPKTSVSARVYPIDRVNPENFTLFGRDRPAVREALFGDTQAATAERPTTSPDLEKLGYYDKNPLRAIDNIAKSDHPFAEVAQKLSKLYASEIADLKFETKPYPNKTATGFYNSDNHLVTINTATANVSDSIELNSMLLHEVIHGLTMRKLEKLGPDSGEYSELNRLAGLIYDSLPGDVKAVADKVSVDATSAERRAVFQQWEQEDPANYDKYYDILYGLSHPYEFAAQALSSKEFRDYAQSVIDPTTKGSVWQRFTQWVKNLIFGKPSAYEGISKTVDKILEMPQVNNTEWMDNHSFLGGIFNYPEIRTTKQYEESANYRPEVSPEEEKELLNRKALANNNWLQADDIQQVLSTIPEKAKGVIKSTIGNRLAVLDAVKDKPGAEKPSTLQDIINDPNIPGDRKDEISLSVIHNLLDFKRKSELLEIRTKNKIQSLVDDLPKLDRGINEHTANVVALNDSIERMVDDLKDRIIAEKREALTTERAEQLTRTLTMMNELKGDRKNALGKFMDSLSQRIDLETLLSNEDPKTLYNLIEHQFPINPETAREFGASEETIRMASILMANSNELREELLTIKLLHDSKFMKGVLSLNSNFNEDSRAGKINTVIQQYANKLQKLATRRDREQAVYRMLYSDKINRLKTVDKLSQASNGLKEILNTPSFKNLDELATNRTGLEKVIRFLTDTRQVQFVHPITREPVTVGASFDKDGELSNYLKLYDLAEAAQAYLANPDNKNYSPAEANAWRTYLRNTEFVLNPTISYNARKIIPAAMDPHKVTGLLGKLLVIPDQVLRRIGGRAAIEAIAGLQALSVVDSQLGNLKKKWDATISLTAHNAAESHKLPIEQWHTEVLNPLIASRQTTGYEPLRSGSKNIFGHTITKEDEEAFRVQRDFDREVVKIALAGKGNPAVLANPARITFKAGGVDYQRPVLATGPDTMSRRLNYDTKAWATDWFNNPDPMARKEIMDAHFPEIVLGHADTSGAPDYALKSSLTAMYKKVMQSHKDNPIESTDDFINRLFNMQHEFMDPEKEVTKEEFLKEIQDELSAAFKNVAKWGANKPHPTVDALLKVIDTDNSFTKARGHLIAPQTFYNYGLTFDYNRIARLHSAKAHYTMELASPKGLLDRLQGALDGQVESFKSQVEKKESQGLSERKAIGALKKETRQQQLAGDTIITYTQALDSQRKLRNLTSELRRLLDDTNISNDPDARQLAQAAQNFVVANVLSGFQSQNTNAFGGLGNIMAIDKFLLGRSATLSTIKLGIQAMVHGAGELATNLSKMVDPGNKWVVKTLRNPIFSPVANLMGDVIANRIQMHQEMEGYGLSPAANVAKELRALWEMPTSAGRPQLANPTIVQRGMRSVESALQSVAIPLGAVAPRLVDRFINYLTVQKAADIEDLLRLNAVKFGNAKIDLGQQPGTTFSATELFGEKANTKQELLLRQLFERNAMSLDSLMWRYNEAHKTNPNAEFFTPEERAAFQYSLASDVNLPTFANRLLSGKGSKGRNFLGVFFGYPSWYAGKLSDFLAKTSVDKTNFKYVPSIISASLALSALGMLGIKNSKYLKEFFYHEKTDYPDIFEAKNAQDALIAATVGLFTYVPFMGNWVNNWFLNRPVRNGFDLNSQFLMFNLLNDMYKTTQQIKQEHSATRPILDFMRRWSPLARMAINRLPIESGLTEYFNLSRELKTLAPANMESRKRGKTQMDATPATPILQDMVNSAYNNDPQGFRQAAQEYVKYRMSQGIDPDKALEELKSSWRARHPMVREFGRQPTTGELAQIINVATPEQRQEIAHANQVWDIFSGLLGITSNSGGNAGSAMSVPGSGGSIGRAPAIGVAAALPGGIVGGNFGGGSLRNSVTPGVGPVSVAKIQNPSRQPFNGPMTTGGGVVASAGSGHSGSLRVRRGGKLRAKVTASIKRPNLRLVASATPRGASLRIHQKHKSRSAIA